MNMMVIACGETAILVDAGVTFPEPELLGVDLIIPDFRPLEQFTISALVLTHGHEDHIGAIAHVTALRQGAGLRHGVHARVGRGQARGARRGGDATAGPDQAAGARHGRLVLARVPARDAQHARLRRAGRRDAARRRAAHRGLQDRSDAARRRARRFSPVRPARRRGRPGAALRQHQHRAHGCQRFRTGRRRWLRRDLHEREGQDRRGDVRVEHLPDADPRGPRGAVRSAGGVRRPRGDGQLRDCAAAGIPPDSDRRPDQGFGCPDVSGPGRGLYLYLARRGSRRRPCPESPSTTTATSSWRRTMWWCSRRGRFPATKRRSGG